MYAKFAIDLTIHHSTLLFCLF